MKYKSIYIAGPLTDLSEKGVDLKKNYEQLGTYLEVNGFNVHVPHLRTNPIKFPLLSPQEVWELDIKAITKSDLLVAFVGIPSIGVG
jgi:nucleoside 2-deoxyribosyltransferase